MASCAIASWRRIVWARRGLVWLLLVAGAGAASALIASLPLALAGRPAGLFATWAALAATLALGLAVLAPLKRLADRLVFPGARVTEADVAAWRDDLAATDDEDTLADTARVLLRRRLALPVDGPTLTIAAGEVQLIGWTEAPPATRNLAERFATVVAEAARRLAIARRLVEAEREARLAELGALAATVAHDLRNPLGIVQMAATGAPAEVRAEITEQVGRMNHLVTDILDYARAWTVVPQPVPVRDLIAPFGVATDAPDDLVVHADPRALTPRARQPGR